MSDLLHLLTRAVAAESRDDRIALLLSAGLDALSVGLAAQAAGKTVHAYTYRLDRFSSRDLKKAIALAAHFKWRLTVVTVPTTCLADDFIRLAVEHDCRRKVQFEVTWPLLYILPAIEEVEVWTGWNADEHYGNDRRSVLRQAHLMRAGVSAAERKREFDEQRRRFFEHEAYDPESGDTWRYAKQLAEKHGKRLLDPYLDRAVGEYFLQFDHAQLSPLTKPIVRQALAAALANLPADAVAAGVQMQTGAGVDQAFIELLETPRINRFDRAYSAVSPLCLRWGKEVAKDHARFAEELAALGSAARALTYDSKSDHYAPYVMDTVRRAAAQRRLTALSLCSGGGGTSTGIALAGGRVVLANEFINSAARTYRANFPDTPVDERDIRLITADHATILQFLAQAGMAPNELDLLCADPPCCENSPSRRPREDNGELRAYSDGAQRNISSLIFDAIDIVKIALPKVVLIENVPELRSRRGELFEAVMDAMRYSIAPRERLYYAESTILNAADYGVAQNRRRLFILGIRCDVAAAVGITRDDAVLTVFPPPLQAPVSICSAFAGLQQAAADVYPWHRAMMVHKLGRIVAQLPRNPAQVIRPRHVGLPADSWFSLGRCSWQLPAPTLTVAGQRPGGLSGAIHPAEDRKFSIPELKRLTGLPDDFILTGTLSQAAERICRMIPPPLVKAIADSIYERVLEPHRVR